MCHFIVYYLFIKLYVFYLHRWELEHVQIAIPPLFVFFFLKNVSAHSEEGIYRFVFRSFSNLYRHVQFKHRASKVPILSPKFTIRLLNKMSDVTNIMKYTRLGLPFLLFIFNFAEWSARKKLFTFFSASDVHIFFGSAMVLSVLLVKIYWFDF